MKKLVLAGITLLTLGGLVYFGKTYQVKQEEKKIESRKDQIRKGSQEVFKGCEDISTFDKRRECFHEKMLTMRKENAQVRLKYKMVYKKKTTLVESQDLEDLLQIKKPSDMAFTRCISNTFFFDWQGDYVYISLENRLATVECMDINKEKVLFIPQDVTAEELKEIDMDFSRQIE